MGRGLRFPALSLGGTMADAEMEARVRMLELLLELKGEANHIKDHEAWIRLNTAIDVVAREVQDELP